jgi:phosphate transport system substrate-binding protein
MKRLLACIMMLSLLIALPAMAAELKVGGGGASIASVFNPVKAPFEKATSHNLYLLQSTPKNGLIDLWQGKLDAAVTAVGLDGMIAGADKDGVKIDKAALQVVTVGTNKTVVFIHPSNPVTALSKDQLKGIFTGSIQNWKDVGGKDAPILVVWGKNSPGQNALFNKVIMDGAPLTKEILETTDYKGIKDSVVANPEAIGIDPLGMADATVKVIKPNPSADTPILLITKGSPSPAVKQLVDFIAAEGKKYIKE